MYFDRGSRPDDLFGEPPATAAARRRGPVGGTAVADRVPAAGGARAPTCASCRCWRSAGRTSSPATKTSTRRPTRHAGPPGLEDPMTIAVISGRRYHRQMANLPSPARALTLSAINADYAEVPRRARAGRRDPRLLRRPAGAAGRAHARPRGLRGRAARAADRGRQPAAARAAARGRGRRSRRVSPRAGPMGAGRALAQLIETRCGGRPSRRPARDPPERSRPAQPPRGAVVVAAATAPAPPRRAPVPHPQAAMSH